MVLAENHAMISMLRSMGAEPGTYDDGILHLTIPLQEGVGRAHLAPLQLERIG